MNTIDPKNITDFSRTDSQLQAFWLFGAFCAGKNSDYASKCLARLLYKGKGKTPFEYLEELGETGIHNALLVAKIGQYSRLTKLILQSLELDLRTASLDDLMGVFGIGPKTARFFVLHTRPDCKCAVLDCHILKYLKEIGYDDAPSQTPTNQKEYLKLEKTFLYRSQVDYPHMTVVDIDLMLWMRYSGRLDVDVKGPEFFGESLDNAQ